MFADRPGHSHGGLLILKLRPFVGFKIMIGTDWVYMTFANVQNCQRLRGLKAQWACQRAPLRQRMRAALKLLFGPVTTGGG